MRFTSPMFHCKCSILTIHMFVVVVLLMLGSSLADPRAAYAKPGVKATAKTAAAVCAGADALTFDVYRDDVGFRTSFLALLRAAGIPKPAWVPDGVARSMSPVVIAGKQHVVGTIFEPHNAPHKFVILYAIESGRITAQYVDDDGKSSWLGSPTAAEQKAISNSD